MYRLGDYHPVSLHDIIVGRYKVIHKFGNGGFATIWVARAQDLQEHRYVALKILMGDCPNEEHEECLTGSIRITDFGESFFLNKPPTPFSGTPAAFCAPETLFGRPASAQPDAWALGCLMFELRAWRPLFCTFFNVHSEALLEIVNTLGPLPKAWQNSFCDESRQTLFEPGQWDPWFDSGTFVIPLNQ
ncbi:hypothetical protein MMC31_002731, partial [Peltigera leucophlebia]|nr:hypothetical protein [Peltigera leucophlebia]